MNWIEIIFFTVFIVIPVISKIAGLKGKNPAKPPIPQQGKQPKTGPLRMPPQPRDRQLPDRQPVERAEVVGPDGAGERNALELEIEQFLRRSHDGEKKSRAPAPDRSPVQPPLAEVNTPVRRLSKVPQSLKEEQKTDIGGVVDRDATTIPAADRVRGLASHLEQADEMMEDHLHAVFDHDVSSIDRNRVSGEIDEGTDAAIWETSASKRKKRSDDAGERTRNLIEMLSNPDSMKQAMILSEVLRRPDFD